MQSSASCFLSAAGWCCQSVSFNFRFKSESNICIGAISIICHRYITCSFDFCFCIHPLPPSSYAEGGGETQDDLRDRHGFLSVKWHTISHVHCLYFPSPVCQNSDCFQVVSIHHNKVYNAISLWISQDRHQRELEQCRDRVLKCHYKKGTDDLM